MSQDKVFLSGVVKAVLSGDTVVIRGQPNQGPPPERIFSLAYVSAPKLGRRPNKPGEDVKKDEPFAWKSREILRRLVIGRNVQFAVSYTANGHDFGQILVNGQDLTSKIVSEGAVKLRDISANSPEEHTNLQSLLKAAEFSGLGIYSKDTDASVRNVSWEIKDMRSLVGKQFDGVVEQVRDGSTVRIFLMPNFEYVTVSLAGIKCPMKNDKVTEEYYDEAKYFTEVRLLHRSVRVLLQGVGNGTFLGTVLHPAGNISECLLKEGFARVIDWSLSCTPQNCHTAYRQAENFAKQFRLRLFNNFVPPVAGEEVKQTAFQAKCVEVVNGESIMIKVADGSVERVYFSSFRQPKADPEFADRLKKSGLKAVLLDGKEDEGKEKSNNRSTHFEIPWMFETKEYLRKLLVGKRINVTVDFVKAADKGFPEKKMVTVFFDSCNVTEALISRGFGRVLFHRNDDDNRSPFYGDLRMADEKAEQGKKGVHGPSTQAPMHKITEVSTLKVAKQILPLIQHSKEKLDATCEYVIHGSRLKLFIPKESVVITLLVAGISCPRTGRTVKGGETTPSEPYADSALEYVKELCLQKDVNILIDGLDKVGNFTGSVWLPGNRSLALEMVKSGFASVHPSAGRLINKLELFNAEKHCKDNKIKIWENFVEPVAVIEEEVQEKEREILYTEVVVSEVVSPAHLWVQHTEKLEKIQPLLDELNQDFSSNPPSSGIKPVVNVLCCCKFSDGFYYRARVERVNDKAKTCDVFYIDYGNKDRVSITEVFKLPEKYAEAPALAREVFLACVSEPEDDDWYDNAHNFMTQLAIENRYYVNVEYVEDKREFVTLNVPKTNTDLGGMLISAGLALKENRRDFKTRTLVEQYKLCEEKALNERKSMWEYGDFRPTEGLPEVGL